jgi:DNA polymerase I-like protein with 3'-5' exonuclease and polymerase domains
LLDYCESDVIALAKLLPAMLPRMDLPRAITRRGRYLGAVARMEWDGVPIDVNTLSDLRDRWKPIRDRLIESVDSQFGVFEGRTFKADRWAEWVAKQKIPWPRLESGRLALDDSTFKEMARVHRDVALMRELRVSLSGLKVEKLAVGADGRNRAMLSPFGARSSRNTPSNAKYIFGPSTWLRGLIKPAPGRAVAYVDWCQQEFGIGAALSGDRAMMEAYQSGDSYLAFGKQAGRIPLDGTKETHAGERGLFKTCVLGVQYGMEADTLARRIERPVSYARDLLRLHRETYPDFWRWSDGALDYGMLHNEISTVFGWVLHVVPDTNPRSIRNFPCQANGAEMLRLACCLASERGLPIIAPIHDAIMIEASAESIYEVATDVRQVMEEASAIVLGGIRLRSDVKIVRHPDRYMDERGVGFWNRIMPLIGRSTYHE